MVRLLLSLLPFIAVSACGLRDSALVEHRLVAMATTVEISLLPEAEREHPELLGAIETDLREFERDYYAWTDGELRRLNLGLSARGEFETTPDMAALVARSRAVAVASNGAFDPGVGTLVELWGFNDATVLPTRPPTDAAIATALRVSGSVLDLQIDGTRITGPIAEYTLDLGGIAKGAAVDRVIDRFESLGISPALVNAGGDLRVVGQPEGRTWRIGIQSPRGNELLGTISLSAGEAAFSSGDYERFFESGSERLHHILDPRTGRPALHTRGVTVIATDGTTADAAATGLFVAGPGEWRALAERLGIEFALRVDADGSVEMTPKMRERFQPAGDAPSDIIAAGN